MRSLFFALMLAILAGCSSTGTMTNAFDHNKPRTVFVEPIAGDAFGFAPKLDMALASKGFDVVESQELASYRLKINFVFGLYDMRATARLTDRTTGSVVYFGEGKNGGFGTGLDPAGSSWRVVESSLAALK